MIREIQNWKGDGLMTLFGIRWSRALPCAALAVLAAAGCGDRVPTTNHILLITIDTIRADHLGCYGYSTADTPVIDALASESLLFENAFSTYPLTLPSHASMLTGQLPFEHGLRNNDLIRRDETESMLQEILQARGFGTSAVVSAFVLDSSFGLSSGFDQYVDDFRPDGPQERRADEVTDIALELLDELGDEPFFLWVHYFDPHHPYGDQVASTHPRSWATRIELFMPRLCPPSPMTELHRWPARARTAGSTSKPRSPSFTTRRMIPPN